MTGTGIYFITSTSTIVGIINLIRIAGEGPPNIHERVRKVAEDCIQLLSILNWGLGFSAMVALQTQNLAVGYGCAISSLGGAMAATYINIHVYCLSREAGNNDDYSQG